MYVLKLGRMMSEKLRGGGKRKNSFYRRNNMDNGNEVKRCIVCLRKREVHVAGA